MSHYIAETSSSIMNNHSNHGLASLAVLLQFPSNLALQSQLLLLSFSWIAQAASLDCCVELLVGL